MQKFDSYKKAVLIYGSAFFFVQFILAFIFYRERLYADSSYFLFQSVNTGWFSIEHKRFLLAACEVLPLIGSYLGLSMKAILVLYSFNHVCFFFILFLILILKLDDIYGGLAIMAILVLNALNLYVMPYLESWYASGLAVVLYSLLKQNRRTIGSLILIGILEITIVFSHPEFFILLGVFILLFASHEIKAWISFNGIKKNLGGSTFVLLGILVGSIIYKFLTLDKYEDSHLSWALYVGNSSMPFLAWLKISVQLLIKALIGSYGIPTLLLILTLFHYVKNKKLRRAGIVLLAFMVFVGMINFFFGENTVTMYSSIHYIPFVATITIPFFYDVLPSYSGKIKGIILILLFAVIGLRNVEQVNAIKHFSAGVEASERLITACDKLGGNKFFVKVPYFGSPYVDWTYPIQTLLLSSERGKDKCRSLASDDDTSVIPSTKRIFTDSSLFLISRFDFADNKVLNPKYFYSAPGIYKTINYTESLDRAFSSHLNWNNPEKEWTIKHSEVLSGKPCVHLTGDEFGFAVTIPNESLSGLCSGYYAKITLTHFEPTAYCDTNAVVICDIIDENMEHKFYKSLKVNEKPVGKDSNSTVSSYEFEIPVESLNNLRLSFYIWNVKKEDFYITDASIELFKIPEFLFWNGID